MIKEYSEQQERIVVSRGNWERRCEEVAKALLAYEIAVIEAYNATDKLISLGIEQPWVRMVVASSHESGYGSFSCPGPTVRLQYR